MKVSKLNQVVELLTTKPNISANDIAKKLKVSNVYAYTLLSKARKRSSEPVYVATLEEKIQDTFGGSSQITGVSGKVYEFLNCTPPDVVNQPPHYKVGGIETIDYIEAKELSYHLGNAVKYISRAKHKGNYIQDLEKAKWYLDREINKAKNEPRG
jgi:hypothetical protein